MLLKYFSPINQKSAREDSDSTFSKPSTATKRKADDLNTNTNRDFQDTTRRKQIDKENCEDGETLCEQVEGATSKPGPVDRETEKKQLAGSVPQHLMLEFETMASDWFNTFLKEMEKPYFVKIKSYLKEEHDSKRTVYPAANELYTFTRCPLKKIRVVILGQDPYHGPGQAHGLCFSVKKGVPPPPSLVNIFKEIESDVGPENFKTPKHGHLEGWAEQGVLLLNTALTVRGGQAASHSNIGWAIFTDAVIAYVDKNLKHVVFMLWGGHAQKKGASIDKKKHLVLKSAHPSPLSAHRGFLQCKHFSQANLYLKEHSLEPIDWGKL